MSDVSSTRLNPFRTAPNLLTLARICLAPFLVAAILEGRFGLSFGLFLAAGLTDALDGTLARCSSSAPCWASILTRWPTSCCSARSSWF
jgi:phosphatidylglycerophosphate synthase